MQTTIKDVAKASGVSTFTVSAAINNKGRISTATRKKVLKVVRDLKYDPSRNLPATRRTAIRTLGISTPNINSPADSFFYRALAAAKNATRELGYDYKILSEGEITERAVDNFHQGREQLGVDGMVVFTPLQPWEAYVKNLLAWDIPVALIRRRLDVPGLLTFNDDDYTGTWKLMEHLHGLGRTRIAILAAGEMEAGGAPGRLKAWKEYNRQTGLTDYSGLVVALHGNYALLNERLPVLLKNANPDALFCYHDDLAALVISSLLRMGIRVPEDLAVAGYSNDPIAAQFYPPITTVNIPVEEMVAEACRQLINRSPEAKSLKAEFTFENELVIRESTAGITR